MAKPNETAPQQASDTRENAEPLAFERERLRLERQRLALEVRLKRRELATRNRGLRDIFANPLLLALVGGFVTLITSMVTNYLTASSARDADERRARVTHESEARALQSELIKSFLKTSEPKTARDNLTFLIEAGLLPDYEKQIGKYLKENTKVAPRISEDGAAQVSAADCLGNWVDFDATDHDPFVPVGFALHLGINRVDSRAYGGWDGVLLSAVADANAMAALARRQGFATSVLVDATARGDCVLAAIAQASRRLKAGDIFLLSMSGNGGQVEDSTGLEPDNLQETWVLYDRQLLEEELNGALASFAAGVRIVIVEDCSHGIVLRQLPRPAVRPSVTPRFPAVRRQISADVVILAGSLENQIAADGPLNGAFTGALLEVWNRGAFAGSYQQLIQAVAQKLPPSQKPSLYAYGPNANLKSERAFSINR